MCRGNVFHYDGGSLHVDLNGDGTDFKSYLHVNGNRGAHVQVSVNCLEPLSGHVQMVWIRWNVGESEIAGIIRLCGLAKAADRVLQFDCGSDNNPTCRIAHHTFDRAGTAQSLPKRKS